MDKQKKYILTFLLMAISSLSEDLGDVKAGEFLEELLKEDQRNSLYDDVASLDPEFVTVTLKSYVRDAIESYLDFEKQAQRESLEASVKVMQDELEMMKKQSVGIK